MAAAAETLKSQNIHIPVGEQYGGSLYAMRNAGNVAVRGAGIEHPAIQQLRREFESSVFEGLTSDVEHGNGLRVTKFDNYPVIDNKVMSMDGETSVVELTRNGYKSAFKAAQKDSRMWTEVTRTANDEYNAVEVDHMVAGERDYNTRFAISCDPASAMKRDGVDFWRSTGYIEDVIYIQMYHNGNEFTAGAISFKAHDKQKLRIQLNELGFEIPEHTSVDDFIRHAHTATMSVDEAREFALGIRKACEQETVEQVGYEEGAHQDAVDLLAQNKAAIDGVFAEIYLQASASLADRAQTPELKKVVTAFMGNSTGFNSDIRSQLLKMHNTSTFNERDAQLFHKLAIYAAIERLRAPLNAMFQGPGEQALPLGMDAAPGSPQFLAQMAALVACGVAANRSYSSCGSAINLGAELDEMLGNSPQDAFGGRGKVCNKEVKNGDFVKCPHCSKMVFAIVQDSDKKIECSNSDCALAASEVKAQKSLGSLVSGGGMVLSFAAKKKSESTKSSGKKTLQPA